MRSLAAEPISRALATLLVLLGCSEYTNSPDPQLPQAVMWCGLAVAPEYRCSEYDSAHYRYPGSIENPRHLSRCPVLSVSDSRREARQRGT